MRASKRRSRCRKGVNPVDPTHRRRSLDLVPSLGLGLGFVGLRRRHLRDQGAGALGHLVGRTREQVLLGSRGGCGIGLLRLSGRRGCGRGRGRLFLDDGLVGGGHGDGCSSWLPAESDDRAFVRVSCEAANGTARGGARARGADGVRWRWCVRAYGGPVDS